MKRISVSLSDELYRQLETRRSKNQDSSLANALRELVNAGLKAEEFVVENGTREGPQEIIMELTELKNLLRNNLEWMLETRLLTRLLVENRVGSDKEINLEILEKYKARAKIYVSELCESEAN